MEKIKILVVDHTPPVVAKTSEYLEKAGYIVRSVDNGESAMQTVGDFAPDLIITDTLLPKKDGWQIIRELRSNSDVPIIVTSERRETVDKTFALDLGADDYLVKPYDLDELVARLRAVLRRTLGVHHSKEDETLRFDGLEISHKRYELIIRQVPVDVPPKEMELLYFLAENYNRVFTRDQLLNKVWGFDYLGDSRTVDVHIKRLRQKLKGISDQWSLKTVWGVGYKFEVNGK